MKIGTAWTAHMREHPKNDDISAYRKVLLIRIQSFVELSRKKNVPSEIPQSRDVRFCSLLANESMFSICCYFASIEFSH